MIDYEFSSIKMVAVINPNTRKKEMGLFGKKKDKDLIAAIEESTDLQPRLFLNAATGETEKKLCVIFNGNGYEEVIPVDDFPAYVSTLKSFIKTKPADLPPGYKPPSQVVREEARLVDDKLVWRGRRMKKTGEEQTKFLEIEYEKLPDLVKLLESGAKDLEKAAKKYLDENPKALEKSKRGPRKKKPAEAGAQEAAQDSQEDTGEE